MYTHIRVILSSSLVSFVLFFSQTLTAEEKSPYSRIIAFGDSLMDPGNHYELFQEVSKAPYLLPIPEFPYVVGGGRFSNGRTWVEHLGQRVNLFKSTKSALAQPKQGTNFAIGGARARDVGFGISASSQIQRHLDRVDWLADPDALYIYSFGGNDLRDVLADPPSGAQIILDTVTVIGENLATLCLYGATNIAVGNIPNFSRTPAILGSGANPLVVEQTVQTFNAAIENAILAVEALYCPDTDIHRIDLFAITDTLVASSGLSYPAPCLTFGVKEGAICEEPDQTMFWDAIHPTKAAHKFIGNQVYDSLFGN